MSAGEPDVVQVVEADAELGTDERVGRGLELARDAVGLEAEDARGDIVHVVAPAGNHRVPADLRALVAPL